MPTIRPTTRYASRRGSGTLHVITNWVDGDYLTSECGTKGCEVHTTDTGLVKRNALHPNTCKRCLRTLGWKA